MEGSLVETSDRKSRLRWIKRIAWGSLGLTGLFLGGATLFGTWYLRPIRASDGHIGLLFLEAKHVYVVPSDAPASSVILSTRFPFLTMSTFSLGWRDSLESASFERLPEVEGTVVVLKMKGLKQYCSVFEGRLRLIRLETHDGHLAPNIYYAPNITMGPRPVPRTAEEWEKSLSSPNAAEILDALVWLGGYHAPPGAKPVPMLLHEDLVVAQLAYDVQQRIGVQSRIHELGQSSNAWVLEAAQAAKEPHITPLRGP